MNIEKNIEMSGYWKDTFVYPDHREETEYRKNKIVNAGREMLAGLLLGDGGMKPIKLMVQGTGSWSGDPNPSQRNLINEVDRRQPDEMFYLDADNNKVRGPTNKIKIKTVYEKSDPLNSEDPITEEGLFGGLRVDENERNSGMLFNVFNHEPIDKDSSFKLIREVLIQFNEAVQ